jgi:hypothetical protein
MLQYLGSYIWGAEEEELAQEEYQHEEVEIENDWLYIPKDNENNTSDGETIDERTFNLAECNLFCLPPDEEGMECGDTVEERLHEIVRAEENKSVGAKRHMMSKRQPLKDLNAKIAIIRKKDSPKNLKRNNNVHIHVAGARKNKQFGRMQGKHSAMVGPRNCRK